MSIGENIKRIRKRKGLTQKDLAKILNISTSAVNQFEESSSTMKLETLEKISKALDIPVKRLIFDSSDIEQPNSNENSSILNKAVKTYGVDAQLDMCIEEMSELTKEICKLKRGKNNHDEIVEEMADVYIMMEQLKIMINISPEEIELAKDIKLGRLRERLNDEC